MSTIFRSEALDATFDQKSGRALRTWLPSWTQVASIGALLAATVVLGMTLISYNHKVATRGTLIPTGGITQLNATSNGLILELRGELGDELTPGDLVAVIAPNGIDRTTDADLLLQRHTWQNEASSIRSQSSHATDVARLQQTAVEAKRARLVEDLSSVKRERTLLLEQISLAEYEIQRWQTLAVRGVVAQQQVANRQIDKLQLMQRSEELARSVSSIERAISATHDEVLALQTAHQAAQQSYASQLAALDLRLSAIEAAGRIEIVSPRAGVMSSLEVKQGETVALGQSIATVAAGNAVAEAEVWITASTPGDIAIDSPCLARIDAFPYQTHGQLRCRVLTVATSPTQRQSQAGLPAYRATVGLTESSELKALAGRLKPGMTVSVDIVLERRTLFDWLSSPLRAARERISSG